MFRDKSLGLIGGRPVIEKKAQPFVVGLSSVIHCNVDIWCILRLYYEY